jgi:uncharacterized protein YfaS (alpha-2-macroglobulin family)
MAAAYDRTEDRADRANILKESRMLRVWLFVVAIVCAVTPAFAFADDSRDPDDAVEIEVEVDESSLKIEFSESMRVLDNTPVREVTIRPYLALECYWGDDVTIECLTESGELLPPANRIQVEIAQGLFTADGRPIGGKRLTVETEKPELSARIMEWAAGVPKIRIDANMPIALEEATRALELRSDGRVWRDLHLTEVRTTYERWERKAPRYALTLPADLPADAIVELWRREGLASTAGPLRAAAPERRLSFRYAEPFRVRGAECTQRKERRRVWATGDLVLDCVAGESLQLLFSAPLSEAAQKAFEATLPPGVRVVRWRDHYETPDAHPIQSVQTRIVVLSAPQPLSTFDIELDGGLRDQAYRALYRTTRVTVRNGLPMPSLRATGSPMLLGDPQKGNALTVNAPAVAVDASAYGKTSVSESFVAPKSRESTVVFSSNATRQALREGGSVEWRPQGSGVLRMAAPQFDLSAHTGAREVVAWAIGWEDHRPIANATIELSLVAASMEERVVARGKTNREGVARVTLPEDFALPERFRGEPKPKWILRAVSGKRRAVLELGVHGSYTMPLGKENASKRVFAVADRPLYRAGDTVRYRGWARAWRGGKLRGIDHGAIELELVSVYDRRKLRTWSIEPDAEGGFVGEYALPAHMVDGDYCIRRASDDYSDDNVLCFFVGTFRAQDLWVEAQAQKPLLRPGENFDVAVSAGYWSGGGASGIALQRIATRLTAESPAQAYPQYAGYEFAKSDGLENHHLELDAEFPILDADGRARIAVPVVFDDEQRENGAPPPFGRIETTVEVGLAGREGAASRAAVARYAQFDRYVGVRLRPAWFDASTPLQIDGVVIDAAGKAQSGAEIEVIVEYLAQHDGDEASSSERVARCALKAGTPSLCDVPRKRSGRYRFTARSGDAAPATIERYIWNGDDTSAAKATLKPELSVIAAPATADEPMRVLLRQPYPHADALTILSAGGEVLDARVIAIDRHETELTLPTYADGRNRVKLDVLVRARIASPTRADGLRVPPQVTTLALDIDVPPREARQRIEIGFDDERTAPGGTRSLRLRNLGDRPRTVTLAVLDDAVRSLAGERWAAFDPRGATWLGRRDPDWAHALRQIGFSGWNNASWKVNLSWDDAPDTPNDDAVKRINIQGARIPRAVEIEGTAAVLTLDRQAIEQSGLSSVGELDSVGDVLFDIAASDGGALRNGFIGGDDGYDGQELDRIAVTGSRISSASELGVGDAAVVGKPEAGMARSERAQRIAQARALFGARLRRQFEDTALWMPEIRLAPGETREIAFVAPDNLTRWRAVAWSAGADDDFEMVDAVLEAGLSVEARLQAPVRVYPGDRADVVANVRHDGAAPVRAEAMLQVEGLNAEAVESVSLAARGQGTLSLAIAPNESDAPNGVDASRMLGAVAAVRVGDASDAVAQTIELASPTIAARKVQAGWLGQATLQLDTPEFPASAQDLHVRVSLLPGADALVHDWIDDLHRYPHRCWEQILSRAVAAAVALERGDGDRFPGAEEAIREALDNITVFQSERGEFRYFADSVQSRYDEGHHNATLTAYSVRALRFLAALGHAVPSEPLNEAQNFLKNRTKNDSDDPWALQRLAFVAAGQTQPERELLDALWAHFEAQPLPARVATARAMANGRHPETRQAIDKLLAATKRRGESRTLYADQRYDRWMSSDLREQCELIGILREHPAFVDAATRRALIAGLGDLYAGGNPEIDTQAGALCLIALRGLENAKGAQPTRLAIERGEQRAALTLASGEKTQTWERPLEAREARRTLRLDPDIDGDAPASYIVEYRYNEDARRAETAAVGFSLERRYAVLREGRWMPSHKTTVRDGDWVRISLILRNGDERFFVAITDQVPGGLRPTDLALSGVAGLDLQSVSDTGSAWFETRRLDPRAPKFYAEYLPPGVHEVHYFARVGNSGNYLAAPAVAELMYGATTRARTAATRIEIETRIEETEKTNRDR